MANHVEILKDENNNAADLYTGVLRVPQEGMALDTMKNRFAVMEKFEKTNDKLVLENAGWKVLNDALKVNKRPQAHSFIIQACDAVSEVEKKEAT